MRHLRTLFLFILLSAPLPTFALDFDFSTFPPSCEIEGEIISVKYENAYSDEVWGDLSYPERYRLNVKITQLNNPNLENSYGKSCSTFYKTGEETILHVGVDDTKTLGVPAEGSLFTGTVVASTNGNYFTDYMLSDRSDLTVAWNQSSTVVYVTTLVLTLLIGLLLGRFGRKLVTHK